MLRRYRPASYKHMLVSDSETESDENISRLRERNEKGSTTDRANLRSKKNGKGKKVSSDEAGKPFKSKPSVDRDALVELAKEYQKHMKILPIPRARLSETVVVNWQGLAKTLNNMYGQPLHYLTHMLCKQWDKSRFGSEDEEKPLHCLFKWSNAEAAIWNVEEIHRLCTSPIHLAMLWLSDPEYRAFVDEVIPSH